MMSTYPKAGSFPVNEDGGVVGAEPAMPVSVPDLVVVGVVVGGNVVTGGEVGVDEAAGRH